ncbi:hypothetical protein KI688_006967 [Linnemannia hyalina]|uniref:Uncharacterized protein n=1 Tax=Linnemannia hyalina TaxID=64524 RepID=A0A9P7XLQ5_9FUNG|nr:hypothetical protein KI688_006967 [Linnemannia hyalina]
MVDQEDEDEDETGVGNAPVVPDWEGFLRREDETAVCRNADKEEDDDDVIVAVVVGVIVAEEEDRDRVAGEAARRDLEWGRKEGGCSANDNDAIGLYL